MVVHRGLAYAPTNIAATLAVLLRRYIASYMGSIAYNPRVQQDLFIVPYFFFMDHVLLSTPLLSPSELIYDESRQEALVSFYYLYNTILC